MKFLTYRLIVKTEKFVILILKHSPTPPSPLPSESGLGPRMILLPFKQSAFGLSQLGSGCILVFLNLEGWLGIGPDQVKW